VLSSALTAWEESSVTRRLPSYARISQPTGFASSCSLGLSRSARMPRASRCEHWPRRLERRPSAAASPSPCTAHLSRVAREHRGRAAVQRLRVMHPDLRLVGYRHGYFAEEESPQVTAAIRDSGAQILFVAISSPRKERRLDEHGPTLNVPFVMGVGGSIDVVAGIMRHAPRVHRGAFLPSGAADFRRAAAARQGHPLRGCAPAPTRIGWRADQRGLLPPRAARLA